MYVCIQIPIPWNQPEIKNSSEVAEKIAQEVKSLPHMHQDWSLYLQKFTERPDGCHNPSIIPALKGGWVRGASKQAGFREEPYQQARGMAERLPQRIRMPANISLGPPHARAHTPSNMQTTHMLVIMENRAMKKWQSCFLGSHWNLLHGQLFCVRRSWAKQ